MNIASLNNNSSSSLNLERIANLPKEIFQAQSEINSKLLKLNMLQNIERSETGQSKKLLDVYS